MNVQNHRMGIRNHRMGALNHNVGIRYHDVGIDRKLRLKEASKLTDVQQN